MDSAKILIGNYWIDKLRDKELFMKIRRDLPKFRKFVSEQIGWRIIENEKVIKVEKKPAAAYDYMGITEFNDIFDYCILSAVLIFLEDREDGESFLLSELIDVIEIHLREFMEVNWTSYSQRNSLVRVLQFSEKMGFINVYEGITENISVGIENEVLYENTGLSRYFAIGFNFDISDFKSYKDFEKKHIEELEENRGHVRTNRVYRELISSSAVYWNENNNQDGVYIKNQRQYINKNLSDYFDGKLQVYKNAAFFVMEEKDCFGNVFPGNNMEDDIILLICSKIRHDLEEGLLKKEQNDCIYVSKDYFMNIIKNCKEKYSLAWTKTYREMDVNKIVDSSLKYMIIWKMIDIDDDKIVIFPAVGKFCGKYFNVLMERSEKSE